MDVQYVSDGWKLRAHSSEDLEWVNLSLYHPNGLYSCSIFVKRGNGLARLPTEHEFQTVILPIFALDPQLLDKGRACITISI